MSHRRAGSVLILLFLAIGIGSAWQDEPELSPEEKREQLIIQRFQEIVERKPRRGTALDRIYGHHVERGTLDKLIADYRSKAKKDDADGVASLMIGMLESQRGNDAEAVDALRQAENRRPDDAIPGYYLGQSLVLLGQPRNAAEAFERALKRNPSKADALEIYQALGRVYQRAQQPEKAIEVWNRLEQQFPNDERVQEQIVLTLIEEGENKLALPRLEKLAATTRDRYQKTLFRIEAAELKVKLNQRKDGLNDLETMLDELEPSSWLHREVRRKIEEVFLRNDDLAGLADYYAKWLEAHPQDVDAMARLAGTLGKQGRLPEARAWLEKAIPIAPTRVDLRRALIDQLVLEGKTTEVVKQYEELNKVSPSNPDIIREWGRMVLQNKDQPEAERRKEAIAVWKKLLENRPNDPTVTTQVADLVRAAELPEEAIALYRKAIELAPESAQYREYLGEYLHTLKRKDEALAAWKPIAEGKNRTAKNLTRLAEVYAGFGYAEEALTTMAEAIKLEPEDFDLKLRYAGLLAETGKYQPALEQLASAQAVAENDEERESILQEQIKIHQLDSTLAEQISTLETALAQGKEPTPTRWHRLALYLKAARRTGEANEAIQKSLAQEPESIRYLSAAAEIQEADGSLLESAETYRRLAKVDRRFRTEYLTKIAQLEARLGRKDEALQAGRDLLAAAPGNPENYKFFAELCFSLGEDELGLDALRRSVRANPGEPEGLMVLAAALGERFRNGEAIELLWRAFEKTNDLDGRLGIVEQLADRYLQNDQFDRLMERLERDRREPDQKREMTLYIAQALQKAGDIGTARQELEQLLVENPRDTQLLAQLAKLAENEGDLDMAIQYQRQHLQLAPKEREVRLGLAQLLVKSGESEEAGQIWVDLVADEPDAARNLSSIDALIKYDKTDTALAILTRLTARDPDNWEYLYREGVCHSEEKQKEQAKKDFEKILTLNLTDDTPGAARIAARKNAARRQRLTRGVGVSAGENPLASRSSNIHLLLAQSGLDARYSSSYYSIQQQFYTPSDYGQARLAAMAWLLRFAQLEEQEKEFIKEYETAAQQPQPSRRSLLDWFYLNLVKQDNPGTYAAAKLLSQEGDAAGNYLALRYLPSRVPSTPSRSENAKDTTPPLPPEQIETMLQQFAELQQQKPEWISSYLFNIVTTELKRADMQAKADQLYAEAKKRVTNSNIDQMNLVMSLASERGDVETMLAIYKKLDHIGGTNRNNVMGTATREFYQATGPIADNKEFPKMLKLLEAMQDADRVERVSDPSVIRRRQRTASRSSTPYFYKRVNGSRRYTEIPFPKPNPYLEGGNIQLLRTIFEEYKQADLLSDLFAYVEAELKKADDPARKIDYQLMLAYIRWWDDRKDEAIEALRDATKIVPDDPTLILSVADILEENNRLAEALELLDSVEPKDQQIMMEREESAMKLAERLGDVDRARTAAERLFGLRLRPEKQADLAGRMHRLGMHKEAEAVLSRAQRQAGNKTDTLRNLMRQYTSQNNSEMAINIARRILRKSVPIQSNNYYSSRQSEDEAARGEAVQVLARSGKLDAMIERAKAQLQSSPNSIQIRRNLMDYLLAADRKEEFVTLAKELAALHPDDAQLRFAVAKQLQQAGQPQAACDAYLAAIKLDAMILRNSSYELQQIFDIAKRKDELIDVMLNIDLSTIRNDYYVVTNMLSGLLNDEKTKEAGKKLFEKAWKELPEARETMIRNLRGVYDNTKMYTYAKEAVFPIGKAVEPWPSNNLLSYSSYNGVINSTDTMLLDYAREQNRVEELRDDLAKALKKHPEWKMGETLLAILDVQTGRTKAGVDRLSKLVAEKDSAMPMMTRYLIAQELAYYGSAESIVRSLYDQAIEETFAEDSNGRDYPIQRAILFYGEQGQKDKATELIRRTLEFESDTYSSNPGYAAEQKISKAIQAMNQFMANDALVEAIRAGNNVLADTTLLELAKTGYNNDYYTKQLQSQVEQANKQLKQQSLMEVLDALIQKPTKTSNAQFDLAPMVERPADGLPIYTNLIDKILKESKPDAKLLAQARTKLSTLKSDDRSVLIGQALLQAEAKDWQAFESTAKSLQTFVQTHPLETLPEGTKANSRQRAEAAARIPFWFVARLCLQRDETHKLGTELADHALTAALRQSESDKAIAILNEWGQIDFDAKRKPEAQKHWQRMLELVVPTRTKQTSRLLPETELYFVQLAPPATSKAKPKVAVPVLTEEQFTQTLAIAEMLAKKELLDLSLEACRNALQAGPPIPPAKRESNSSRINVSSTGVVTYTDIESGTSLNILAKIESLLKIYRVKNVADDRICNLLSDIALPEARPAEVFLYPQEPVIGANPKSLGSILAQAAVQSSLTEQVRQRAKTRLEQPLGQLNAHVLLAQLALAAKQPDALREQLDAINAILKNDSLATSANLACLAALPALKMDQATDSALSLSQSIARNYTASNVNDRATAVHFILADHALTHDNRDLALSEIDAALKSSLAGNPEQSAQAQLRATQLFAQAGLLDQALESMGQVQDQSEAALDSSTFNRIVSLMMSLSDEERYAKLKAWTLPTKARKSIRLAADSLPTDVPPAEFGNFPLPDGEIISTMELLLRSAEATGQLKELLAELEPLSQAKIENAAQLQALAQLRLGLDPTSEKFVQEQLAENRKSLKERMDNPRYVRVNDRYVIRGLGLENLLLPIEAARVPATRAKAVELLTMFIEQARYNSYIDSTAQKLVRERISEVETEKVNATKAISSVPKHWTPIAEETDDTPPAWTLRDGLVTSPPQSAQSSLLFDQPIGGTFELKGQLFVTSIYKDGVCSCELSYAGLRFPIRTDKPTDAGNGTEYLRAGNNPYFSVTSTSHVTLKPGYELKTGRFHPFVLQVAPKKWTLRVNDTVMYETTKPPATAPWLMMVPDSRVQTAFTNLQLSGKPTIPKQVPLIADNKLYGWSPLNGRTVPPPRVPKNEALPATKPTNPSEKVYDWTISKGELQGRQVDVDEPLPSRLRYFRPLRKGESIDYEFYHEPGKSMVHPALGQLVFRLENDGVKLHWEGAAWTGLANDNGIAVAPQQLGDTPLPLRPKAWNRLRLTLTDNGVSLILNDTPIYQRPMMKEDDTHFGLFHFQNESEARIRNIVLTGSWSTELPKQLLTATPSEKVAITEMPAEFVAELAERLLAKVKPMDAKTRYQALAEWVLPSQSQPFFRAWAAAPSDDDEPDPARSPWLMLLKTAKELKQLDDLAKRVATPRMATTQRAKLALTAMIQAEASNIPAARDAINELTALLKKEPIRETLDDPNSVYSALRIGVDHPELFALCDRLAEMLDEQLAKVIRDQGNTATSQARTEVANQRMKLSQIRGELAVAALPKAERPDPLTGLGLNYWVQRLNKKSRPSTVWTFHDGVLRSYSSSYSRGSLDLRMPLLGEFTVEATIRADDYSTRISYAGVSFSLTDEFKSILVYRGNDTTDKTTIKPPLDKLGEWMNVRMKVEHDQVEFFINGRSLFSERLPAQFDPWLMIEPAYNKVGAIKEITITGTPTIPKTFALATGFKLNGWKLRLGSMWTKRGDEIFSPYRRVQPLGTVIDPHIGGNRYAIEYQRPMSENAGFTYEFYYVPEKTLTHPLFGSTAFLLLPDGVKPYPIEADNAESKEEVIRLKESKPLPLKLNQWNKMRLSLSENKLSLWLNDTLIYQQPWDEEDDRTFGLFHFQDRTQARVRNLSFTGDWPKSIPQPGQLFEKE